MAALRKLATIAAGAVLLALLPAQAPALAAGAPIGPLTPKDVVYQIITDRFYDGDTGNNKPAGFDPTLFDDPDSNNVGNGSDLKLYQGGDWDGIIAKIPYLKNMGISAVWISAPYRNRDTVIEDHQPGGGIDRWTSFHGYHVRNYFATNKHFGTLAEFRSLRDALHAEGIKLVIDFVTNHTSRWQNPTLGNAAEDGKLYEPDKDGLGNYVFNAAGEPIDNNGDGITENLLANPHADVNGWFHGLGDRGAVTVKFGTVTATVTSNSDGQITTTVPAGAVAGVQNITVTKGANVSNTFRYEVLSGNQVQVIFKINTATVPGENIHVVGNIPELGSWDAAKSTEAMHNPNYPEWFLPVSVPAGTTIQFKFLKKNGGSTIWEGGSNRSFTVPADTQGSTDTTVYTWQP